MLVTVTNLTANTLNALSTITASDVATLGPAALSAIGGSRSRPLPYPFDWVVLGPNGGGSDAKQLPMNQRDWRRKSTVALPQEPGEEWAALVSAKVVSVAFAAQAGQVDPENAGINTI